MHKQQAGEKGCLPISFVREMERWWEDAGARCWGPLFDRRHRQKHYKTQSVFFALIMDVSTKVVVVVVLLLMHARHTHKKNITKMMIQIFLNYFCYGIVSCKLFTVSCWTR